MCAPGSRGLWHRLQSRYDRTCIDSVFKQASALSLWLRDPQYGLVLETNDSDTVTFVYRRFGRDRADSTELAVRRWLGRFFYCIDSGDSAADELFDSRILLRQADRKDKTRVLASLMRLPVPLQVRALNIHRHGDYYALDVQCSPFEQISFIIPHDRLDPLPVYLHQQRFAEKVNNALFDPHDADFFMVKTRLDSLPRPHTESDSLVLDYSNHRRAGLEYLKATAQRKIDGTLCWRPLIQVRADSKRKRLLINKNLSLPLEGELIPGLIQSVSKLLNDFYLRWVFDPCPDSLSAGLQVRGYRSYDFSWSSSTDWRMIRHLIYQLGRPLFLPARVTADKGVLILDGIFMIDSSISSYHHFGEWTLYGSMNRSDSIQVVFYPYIRNQSPPESLMDSLKGLK